MRTKESSEIRATTERSSYSPSRNTNILCRKSPNCRKIAISLIEMSVLLPHAFVYQHLSTTSVQQSSVAVLLYRETPVKRVVLVVCLELNHVLRDFDVGNR